MPESRSNVRRSFPSADIEAISTEDVEECVAEGDLQGVSQFDGRGGGQGRHDAGDGGTDVRTQREGINTLNRNDSQPNQRCQRRCEDRTALHENGE